jgi:hypothetical protein
MVAICLLLVYLIRPFQPPYLLLKSELGGFAVLELTSGCTTYVPPRYQTSSKMGDLDLILKVTQQKHFVRSSDLFLVFFFLDHKKQFWGISPCPNSQFFKTSHLLYVCWLLFDSMIQAWQPGFGLHDVGYGCHRLAACLPHSSLPATLPSQKV